jgi:hypothetical protein
VLDQVISTFTTKILIFSFAAVLGVNIIARFIGVILTVYQKLKRL